MSRLRALLRRALAWLTMPVDDRTSEPIQTLRDWADLPPHHPDGRGTPC